MMKLGLFKSINSRRMQVNTLCHDAFHAVSRAKMDEIKILEKCVVLKITQHHQRGLVSISK